MLEKMSESVGERETPASGAAIETNDAKSSDSSSSPSASSSKKGRESRSRKSASRKNSKKMKAEKQEREEQSSHRGGRGKDDDNCGKHHPEDALETVRDVKHVHEAEKKVKENGGSLIDVVAEIQEKEEESDTGAPTPLLRPLRKRREGEGERGGGEDNLNDDDTDDTGEPPCSDRHQSFRQGVGQSAGPQTNVCETLHRRHWELISMRDAAKAPNPGASKTERKRGRRGKS